MSARQTPAPQRGLVSVIVPCYNAQRFLPQTMESVWKQTYAPLEVILVDDGSSDGTRALIEGWSHRAHGIFTPNRGAAAARNAGVAAARGEYLQFLDADDLLAPDALSVRVDALRSHGGDVAYSDWQRLQETASGSFELGEIIQRRTEDVHPDLGVALFTHFWAPPAALLYTREIVEKIGPWKQHLAPIEDARFMLDAALAGGKFIHVPGVRAHYRVFDGPSHSRRDPTRFVQSVLANALEVEALWRSRGALDAAREAALAGCFDYAARSLFRNDPAGFALALRHLRKLRPGLQPAWPRLADALQRVVGRSASLRLLGWMGKPAP